MMGSSEFLCKYCGEEWESAGDNLFGLVFKVTCRKCGSSGDYYIRERRQKNKVDYYRDPEVRPLEADYAKDD